jgi:TRAP-type C4-dicarboxylate transport system substrate-binding protein
MGGRMKKVSMLIAFAVIFVSTKSVQAAELKLAIVAPEGSTWAKVMDEWNRELIKRTNGNVKIKIYAGGVLGDEKDVIRKMQIGQVHIGGFTGLGLGIVNPQVRVLELPMLFNTYEEADYVTSKIQPKLEAGFEKKGFVLLGWAETGFVNIFSNRPIGKREDMDGMKMWMWEGDPLVKEMYDRFGIVPIPLALTDVLTSLSTNLIDAVYAPPLGAIALQWFTKTKYMTDLKLADSTGGILITKQAFSSLSPSDQNVLKETARKYAKILVDRTRQDNDKSYDTLARAGIKTVKVSQEEIDRIRDTSMEVWKGLAGRLYTQELLNETIAAVSEKRK